MSEEPELDAMIQISAALSPLDAEQRGRALRWAAERFDVTLGLPAQGKLDPGEVSEPTSEGGPGTFDHFADLHDAVAPSSNPERALVAGYWVQVIEGQETFVSADLNRHLAGLGHKDENINKSMTSNIKKTPSHILQVGKSGSSKQARRTYKLTDAGRKWVAERIAASGDQT